MDVDQENVTVSQGKPLPGRSQVQNRAGGYGWEVDDLKRFRRFLVLGCEQPTYYIGEKELGLDNVLALSRLIASSRGVEVVEEIVNFSVEGRTAKQGPIIFALATCARSNHLETKRKAYEVLSQVCRTPTHLFMFVDMCEKISNPTTGWGRAHRSAIKKWYTSKEPMKLAMDITKYQRREGWSHVDLARLMHLKPEGEALACIMKYIVKGYELAESTYLRSGMNQNTNHVLEFFKAVEEVKKLTIENEQRIVELIRQHKLVREHIPTACLNSVEVISYYLHYPSCSFLA